MLGASYGCAIVILNYHRLHILHLPSSILHQVIDVAARESLRELVDGKGDSLSVRDGLNLGLEISNSFLNLFLSLLEVKFGLQGIVCLDL